MKEMFTRFLPRLGRVCSSREPENVVLVHLENMGDFVLFSAVLRETRRNFPRSIITVVAQRENRFLVESCNIVNHWIWIPGHRRPRFGESTGREIPYEVKLAITYFRLLFTFRRRIDLLIGPDWLLIKNKEQLRKNILFKKANIPGGFMNLHLNYSPEKYTEYSHQVKRNLSILEMYGLEVKDDSIANWILSDNELDSVSAKTSIGSSSSKKIVIGLGSGHAKRAYPPEYLAKACLKLEQQIPKCYIIILGPNSLSSKSLRETFGSIPNLEYLVGKRDTRSAASILKTADLFIGNDSGFAHIAASFRVPTLVLSSHPKSGDPWHLHSPLRYHPWKTKYKVLQPAKSSGSCSLTCRAESPHCIKSIKIEDIVAAALELMNQKFKSNKSGA